MKKLIASLAAAMVMLFVAAPTADAAKIAVCSNIGNGAFSHNKAICVIGIGLRRDGKPSIVQKNKFKGTAVVIVGANTGGNSSSFNTGGTTTVKSGKVKGNINIWTAANLNIVR